MPLFTRRYGSVGPCVVVLHGGPGAAGYMAPVASGLADSFQILEPFQRGSGAEPLTVARHVADLHDLLQESCADKRPALVGSSWGAMLALAYAAAHPEAGVPLVLIGCGTFDLASRARMHAILDSRMDKPLRQRVERLAEEFPDPDQRLRIIGNLLLPLYSCQPIATHLGVESCDARAFEESWNDMLRLQRAGVYPAAFAKIHSPVLMLHGAADPHPGRMIRDSLTPFLPQLEYREWERCGHYPWLEEEIRDEFFSLVRQWLTSHLIEE